MNESIKKLHVAFLIARDALTNEINRHIPDHQKIGPFVNIRLSPNKSVYEVAFSERHGYDEYGDSDGVSLGENWIPVELLDYEAGSPEAIEVARKKEIQRLERSIGYLTQSSEHWSSVLESNAIQIKDLKNKLEELKNESGR